MPRPVLERQPPGRRGCVVCGHCLRAGDAEHTSCQSCTCLPETLPAGGYHIITPEDGRFLPYYERPGVRNPQCGIRSVPSGRWYCTRESGHVGDHAAHQNANEMMCRWPNRQQEFSCASCGGRANACSAANCAQRRYCTNCCACNNVPMREQERNLFLGEPSKRYPRYVGVEVECGKLASAKTKGWSNVRAVADKYRFRIGSDGSIQQFHKASEISTTPARGDALDAQLKELGEALIKDEIKANSSCGLHVHVDVRDYTIDHLMNFVYLWDRLEKPLYRLVAKSRRTNNYSKVWGDKFKTAGVLDRKIDIKEREKKLDTAIYGSVATAQQYKSARNKHESRYHGVNLNSIPVHGTIEFRLHHGTVNPTKMRMWSAVCTSIVQFAFEHTEEEIRSMKGTNTEILEKVIGDPEVIAWTRARRILFANMERQAHGLVPLAKTAKPASGTSHRRRIPAAEAGELEMSEGAAQ